jgi:hypothetical protein
MPPEFVRVVPGLRRAKEQRAEGAEARANAGAARGAEGDSLNLELCYAAVIHDVADDPAGGMAQAFGDEKRDGQRKTGVVRIRSAPKKKGLRP